MGGLHLSRRQVLAALGACGLVGAAGCSAGRVGEPAAQRSGPRPAPPPGPPGWVLARRFSFGPTPDLVELAGRGPDAFLDHQLDPGLAEDPAVASLLAAIGAGSAGSTGVGEASARGADPERRRAAVRSVVAGTVATAAWSSGQVRAVMADFLADHLHVSIAEAPTVFFVPSYDAGVIRTRALGSFAELLVASARSAAMLVYLDNARSRADGGRTPNENYARELMELHTVGVDGGYDEADVVEVAHVLSGWSLQRPAATFTFRDAWHAPGPLAGGGEVLGWRPSRGGEADGEDLLHHLARHPSTARFVTWKLARRFVADDIAPTDDLVVRLADVYRRSDTVLAPVIREMAGPVAGAGSPAAKLRRPLDLVAAMLRMGSVTPNPSEFAASARGVAHHLQGLGQVPYLWPAPNGYPETAGPWSGAGSVIARWKAAGAAAAGFGGLTPRPVPDDPTPTGVATSLLGAGPGPALARALGRIGHDPDPVVAARAITFASPEFQLR
ncbi:MAG: DUF1800 domain-containing protein [Microthrixaceae bacterium]